MKYLILIILLLFSFNIFGVQYAPLDKVENKTVTGVYSSLLRCMEKNIGPCIELPNGYNSAYHIAVDDTKDDLNNPIWGTRSMITPCDDEADCKAKSLALECVNGREPFYDAEFTEVWCNKIIGYEQISTGKKLIVEDAAKKSEFEAVKQAAKLKEETDKNKFEALKEKLKSSDLSVSEINQALKYLLKL